MRNVQPKWRTVFALAAVLLALAPAGAFAGAKTDFSASAVMTPGPGSAGWSIDTGDVAAAGLSGRFVVKDRTVTGVFAGDIHGPFSFTFGSNVPLLTQSGQFHGTLTAGAYTAVVRGSSSLSGPPALAYIPGLQLPFLPPNIAVVIQLELTGGFTFTDGAQGHGSLNGVFTVAIDPVEGHILFLVPTYLPLLDATTFKMIGVTNTNVNLSGSWSN